MDSASRIDERAYGASGGSCGDSQLVPAADFSHLMKAVLRSSYLSDKVIQSGYL